METSARETGDEHKDSTVYVTVSLESEKTALDIVEDCAKKTKQEGPATEVAAAKKAPVNPEESKKGPTARRRKRN